MPTADIDELFARTLQGDYEDDEPWEAVHLLRRIGMRQVFDEAVKWAGSADQEEWSGEDYARSLRERFSDISPQRS